MLLRAMLSRRLDAAVPRSTRGEHFLEATDPQRVHHF
jgi:hypothetical protein